MAGYLATSKCGHDKGRTYVVVAETEDSVFLADGVHRTKDRPKRKNIRHIQPVCHLPAEAAELLKDMSAITDLEIKRVLKIYKAKQEVVNV